MAYNVPPIWSEVWVPPRTPHAANDEFETSSLNAAWTRTYSVSASAIDPLASFNSGDVREDINSFRKSWMRLQPSSVAGQVGIHKPFPGGGALPDGLYLARMKFAFRFGGATANDSNVSLQLTATSAGVPDNNNKVGLFLTESDAGTINPETNLTNNGAASGVSMSNMAGTGNHFEYAAIIRNSNVFSMFVGTHQGSWVWLQNATYVGTGGGSPAIDRIFLTYQCTSNASPGNMIGGWDFFRYYSSKDLP